MNETPYTTKSTAVLKISRKSHKRITAHCRKVGAKIYVWVEKHLLQAIEKENE